MKTLEIPKKTNSYGSKCRQIEGNEERTRDYKDMLYSYQKLWAQDADLINFHYLGSERANIVDIGNKLNTTVYIVAFVKNLQKYKIYNLTKDDGIWIEMNQAEHIAWHHKMRDYDFDEFLDFKPYYPKYI